MKNFIACSFNNIFTSLVSGVRVAFMPTVAPVRTVVQLQVAFFDQRFAALCHLVFSVVWWRWLGSLIISSVQLVKKPSKHWEITYCLTILVHGNLHWKFALELTGYLNDNCRLASTAVLRLTCST